jgi:hydrogenase/urease accessory protein HupE
MSNQDRRSNFTIILCLAWLLVILAAVSTFAHDPGLSVAEIKLEESRLEARLTFAREEIAALVPMDSDHDGQITQAEFDATRAQLEEMAIQSFIVSVGGRDLPPTKVSSILGDSNALHLNLIFPATVEGRLGISAPLLARLARGHRQFLTIRDATGKTLSEKMLDANNSSFESDVAALIDRHHRPQSFSEFFMLGIEHILMGFDHLAFLFALLIIGGSLREAAKIITSFTVAHSITLAVATFNLVNLSPGIVEPLIAVSIIYVGIENIFRREIKGRWLLTFAFGLIHGFGFATVLRELGIGPQGGAVVPLLSFNLGVETGQIAIAALLLPLIWKLKRQPSFALRFAPACSILVALAGGYWLIERTVMK